MLSPQPGVPCLPSSGKRTRKSSVNESPDPVDLTQQHGEAHVTASVGSNEDLDYLDEDLLRTRESRETGYVGQNSEVQWLRSVQRQSQSNDGQSYGLPYGPPGIGKHAGDERSEALHQRREKGGHVPIRHITDATFYLDSDNIELEIVVNPYELPDPEIAEQLLHCYMSTVHSTFPVVPRSFEDQVRRFISALKQNRAFQVPDRWRALMNLIFAIGAKHSHLTNTGWQGDERDHLVYMTRASHLLGMNSTIMFISAPDLLLVQATAVFSIYFLAIGHVSRAWLMVGISIRLALALGLHLRNEDPAADSTKKEMLLRTWWSLHSIECLASSITGRPPIISNEDCTVPLPAANVGDKQPASKRRVSNLANSRSQEASSQIGNSVGSDEYLVNTIKIELLTQRVLTSLYAPRTAARSWQVCHTETLVFSVHQTLKGLPLPSKLCLLLLPQNVQGRIKDLLQDLEEWSSQALSGAKSPSGSQQQGEVEREHLLLLMHYWSTKILITRPCLCRTERRIQNESDTSAAFNVQMANICVTSAREMMALFPDEPDLDFVYMKAPWWNVIHIIMQCAAVLLLEVGYQSRQTKDNNASITADIQKLINWLQVMQQNDPVAERAYYVVRRILQNVAPVLQEKAIELLAESVASSAADMQIPKRPATAYGRQSTSLDWAQGNFFDGSASATGHQYYAERTDQNYYGTGQFPQDVSPYGSFPLEDLQLSGTFGNPFVNNWDEDMPLAGVQNPWHNPLTSSTDQQDDLSNMNLYPVSNVDQGHQQGQ
ncbi:uncharacterized protein M421DRAFT_231773 [Didymella exigua CBS 183.55]|uniref:Xylanolytic transcriptional activator regulatory domain-containing protein n=1 Tax=Didymella exigua CBS 183.55 TaxID=1150837 RepID=A0A6A5RH37_9PLEO|nr:uncharacterized protein M421DRAFT_231773 [Didymella exigua CBS 183.55]KAF1925796.1 hypothetical protein M421DRAFT_231773 [Didymella exigua CBS 183.55]